MAEEPEARGGTLDRFLRVFSDVHAGEGGTALLLLANLFLLLVSYYIFKTVREPLVLLAPLPAWIPSGAAQKSYAAAGQALVLMGFIPLYSWFSSRVDRLKLIFGVTIFFIVNIELFFLGSVLRAPYLGVIFYIWVGIFSLATIAQFWSFANDIYRKEAGERLFPLIAIGSTVGSAVGSKVAELLFAAKVSAYSMFHLSAALLGVQLVLYWIISGRVALSRDRVRDEGSPLPARNGFGLVFASPYLRLLALLIVLLNLVNTTGNYIIDSLLLPSAQAAAAADPTVNQETFVGTFYGGYYFYVNLLTVLIQAFLVSRIVKYVGLAGVVLALPLVAFGGYGLMAAGAGLAVIRWAKIGENATDYSVMNTARAMLWLPTSREEKYNAKQAIDTFFVRFGDVLSAVLVYAGTAWLSLGVTGFAGVNLVLVVAWLAIGYLLLKENRALASRAEGRPAGA